MFTDGALISTGAGAGAGAAAFRWTPILIGFVSAGCFGIMLGGGGGGIDCCMKLMRPDNGFGAF